MLVPLCSGVARLGVARLGVSRLLTTPVQARFPIDAGGVVFFVASPGDASWCAASRVCVLVSSVKKRIGKAGHGTKLVQARGRINAGGLGCATEWCGGLMLVMARNCRSR